VSQPQKPQFFKHAKRPHLIWFIQNMHLNANSKNMKANIYLEPILLYILSFHSVPYGEHHNAETFLDQVSLSWNWTQALPPSHHTAHTVEAIPIDLSFPFRAHLHLPYKNYT
jgi:hypothetical protein